MPLKTVEIEGKTYGELDTDGNPVYALEDGKELGYDGEALAGQVTKLNGEAARRRTEAKEANDKLSAIDERIVKDPSAALSALDTVASLNDKQLIDAGEVDKVKNEAIKATTERYEDLITKKYKPLEGQLAETKTQLHEEMIGGRFARSAFIEEKVAYPAPMLRDTFGKFFHIDEDKVIARYANGEDVFSRKNPGMRATFDEAIEILIDESPHRDNILKSGGKKGSGGKGGGGGGPRDGKSMTVGQFEDLSHQERHRIMEQVRKGEMRLIDDAA